MNWILSVNFLSFLGLFIAVLVLIIVFVRKPDRFSFSDKPVSETFDLNEYLKGNWTAEYVHKQSRERIRERVTFGEGGRYHVNEERVPLFILKQITFNDQTSELSWKKMSYSLKKPHSVERLKIQDGRMDGVDNLNCEVIYERKS